MAPSRPNAQAVGRTAAFVGYTSGALLSFEVHERLVPRARRPDLLERYRRRYCRDVLRLFGVRWTVTKQVSPATGARLVVANHRSVIDIPLLIALFGGHVLSRADVGNWPLLGRVARRAGTVFVDRASQVSGASAIRTIRRHLKEGRTVIVFPEGTTHRGDEVRPFLAGAFVAARGLPVEIVPVGLAHAPGTEYVDTTFGAHLLAVAGRPETQVAAALGEPFSGEGRAADMASRSEREVQALVHRARALGSPGSAASEFEVNVRGSKGSG